MKNRKSLIIVVVTLFMFALMLILGKLYYNNFPSKCVERAITSGSCDKLIVGYQYNLLTRKCEAFRGGGCTGSVPFQDLNSCQLVCER